MNVQSSDAATPSLCKYVFAGRTLHTETLTVQPAPRSW